MQELFINLYEEYETALFKYAYSLLNDYHKSEDVLQDIFLKVARNIKALHGKKEKEIRNYLYIAVRRKVIDIIKKEQKLQVATVDFLNNMKDERTSKEIDNLATKDIVFKVLNQMPYKYKEVLYLYLVVGFKEKEIADLVRETLENNKEVYDPRKIIGPGMKGIEAVVDYKVKVFGSENKA